MESNPSKEKNVLGYNANAETSDAEGKVDDPMNISASAIEEVVCDKSRTLVLCVRCFNTYHLGCVNPPLESMPEGDWRCANCEDLQESITPKKASSNCSICLKGKRKMDWSHDEAIRKKFSTSNSKDNIQGLSPFYLELILSSLIDEICGLDNIHQDEGPSNVASDEELLNIESSEDIERKSEDIVVYEREKEMSPRNETTTLASEYVVPKDDAKMECEIGEDEVVPEGNWKGPNCGFNTDPEMPKDDPSMSNN
ncbi:hypothetical protein VNO77_39127 [Canavalia gladiata]|uniref:Zinc finger PHD-type domain-containing protein n=1 Tax=Canavalia gladiata TaxID=3824 RepID=A0AAN9PXI0_CANGL